MLVKAKNIDAKGTISRSVAIVPNLQVPRQYRSSQEPIELW